MPVYQEPKIKPVEIDIKTPEIEKITFKPKVIDDDSFFKINEEKLKNIVTDVKTDMNIARYSAIERANAQYAEVLRRSDAMLATGTVTPQQAIEKATEDLARMGLNSIRYKDGRMVNVTSYIEMALRTSQHRAVLQAEGVKRDQYGTYLVISPVLHSTCPICQKWQGQVLIDDVFASGKPDNKHDLVSTAIEDGFLHPHCRHPLATYIEGVTQIPKQSDLDQTKSNYDAEVRQRQIEHMIRRWKRKEALAQTDKERKSASNKVKLWQSQMRDHLKVNPQLRRNYQREKLMDGPQNILIRQGRQKIHRQGTKEYLDRKEKLKKVGEFGPSYVTINDENIQRLVYKYRNTGIIVSDSNGIKNETIINNNEIVGVVVNNLTGQEAQTSVFKIHYSDKGVHIVPDYPSKKENLRDAIG